MRSHGGILFPTNPKYLNPFRQYEPSHDFAKGGKVKGSEIIKQWGQVLHRATLNTKPTDNFSFPSITSENKQLISNASQAIISPMVRK